MTTTNEYKIYRDGVSDDLRRRGLIGVFTTYTLVGLERLEERKVYHIEVGQLPQAKAEEYIKEIMENHKWQTQSK